MSLSRAVQPSPEAGTPTRARRPRNRRQLIVDAAARRFNEQGYHATSMGQIATDVGITAAALYRHFPGKYSLFVECVDILVDRLVDTVDALAGAGLEEFLAALTKVTVDHRATGGMYRWEARYLETPERRALRDKFAHVVDRVTAALRAEDDTEDATAAGAPIEGWSELRATAALGAIGSITMHHVTLARRRTDTTLLEAAMRVATTPRPTDDQLTGASSTVSSASVAAPPVPRTRRAEIVAAAVPLFEEQGFTNVTIGAIAEAVGLTPSALYRHYPGKADVLAAACLQAASLVEQSAQNALAGAAGPGAAVRALADTFVAYGFEHRQLTSVAEAEVVGLPEAMRRPIVHAQRQHIAVWEEHLLAACPELEPRQARVLIHAAFGVVVEAGRWLRWEDTPRNRALVASLLLDALGLDPGA